MGDSNEGWALKRIFLTSCLLSAAYSFIATPALAQTALSPTSVQLETTDKTYTPDYFTQFAPQTAADMVARLPGFEIRGDEGEERGFGQASLNILINGRRPSSKSSGANEILGRIPAGNVTRIEILDGATLDIPGLSGQVANIVAQTGELSGSWDYAVRFEKGSQPQLGDANLNFSAKSGQIEAVGSVNLGQFIFTEDGDEKFFDVDGNITQNREEKIGFNLQLPSANLNLTWLPDNGHIANLNVSAGRENRNTDLSETFLDLTDSAQSGSSFATNGEDRTTYEVSGDYSFDARLLGQNGQLKLIALHSGEDFDFVSRFLFDDGAPGQTASLFIRNDKEREYIGRAEYSWKTGQTSDWTASFEAALNSLKSNTAFSVDEFAYDPEFAEVEESRLQGNLSRGWALNDRTNLQASIGSEYSVIDVKSDDLESQKLFRTKGLLSASYKIDDTWTLRGQIEHSVGQLDFDTFVSTVSLAEGTASQGNNEIFPEQSWETELEIQKQNPTGLSGRVTLFYDIIEDPIETLLFIDDEGNITQGDGNLDTNAQVYGIEGNLTWVLDDILKGLRLSAEGTLADSSVKDVITAQNRARNRQPLWEYDLEARWDIDGTQFAIEAEVEQSKLSDLFRIDEIVRNDLIRPEIELAAIHKDLLGMQWTIKVQNIIDFEFKRQRSVFDETRNGELIRHELTRRQRGQRISLEVTDTF